MARGLKQMVDCEWKLLIQCLVITVFQTWLSPSELRGGTTRVLKVTLTRLNVQTTFGKVSLRVTAAMQGHDGSKKRAVLSLTKVNIVVSLKCLTQQNCMYMYSLSQWPWLTRFRRQWRPWIKRNVFVWTGAELLFSWYSQILTNG